MTILSRIQAAIAGFTGRARNRVPDWADWIIGHPFIPPEQLDEDFRDAFRKVPIVAAAIGRVQHDVASLPIRVWLGSGERRREMKRADGNLVDLLAKANPRDTGYQLRCDTVGSLKLWGNAYWFLQRFGGNPQPAEIWCLKAHLMEVIPGPNRGVVRYLYNRGGVRVELKPEDIIHFRKYNPDDHPIGMSDLEPVRRQYQAQFYAHIWLKEFFRKGGMVSGVWSVKEGAGRLTEPQIKAIQERLKQLHVGYNKAWDPVVVEALEFVKRGMTLSEMELETHLNIINADVCRAIGVPPWMMGIKEGSTLGTSGAEVDRVDYVYGTLKREATLIDTTINEELAPLFGEGIEIETDFSGVQAVQSAMLEQAKSLVIATGRAVMTVNEARQRQGLEPHEDPTADELYTKPEPQFGLGATGDERGEPRQAASRFTVRSMIEGDEGREQLRRRAATALERAEGRMLAFLKGRLDRQERAAVRRLKEGWQENLSRNGKAVKFIIDIDRLLDPEDEEDLLKIKQILEEFMRQRGREAAIELSELVRVAEKIEIDLNNRRVSRFIETQMDRAIIVPDGTTKQMLRESLSEGLLANEGLDDMINRVRSVFTSRQNMAATIARTEVLPGFNLAAQEVWRESGLIEEQEWLTARDSAVRDAHAEVDGDKAPIDGVFILKDDAGNRHALAYPGDPSGPPGLTINCRCTVLPVVDESVLNQARWKRFMENGAGEKQAHRLREWFRVTR